MLCTGCGSDEYFFKDCTHPNKHDYRAKKLKEISDLKGRRQKAELRSYYLQMDDASEESCSDTPPSAKPDDLELPMKNDDVDKYRAITSAIDDNLDESMFLEPSEIDYEDSELAV